MTNTSKIGIPRKSNKGQFSTLDEAVQFKNQQLLKVFQNIDLKTTQRSK